MRKKRNNLSINQLKTMVQSPKVQARRWKSADEDVQTRYVEEVQTRYVEEVQTRYVEEAQTR